MSAVLWSRGIRRLDAVALTHAHHDHMGGLPAILRNFRPRELWVGKNPPVAAYRELMDEAAALGVAVRSFHAGETVQFGEAEIRVLAPDAGYRPGAQPANNDSLVLRASLSESSVLLAGDAEGPEEEAMLAEAGLRSNLLKVGHHGSLTSTHARFWRRLRRSWRSSPAAGATASAIRGRRSWRNWRRHIRSPSGRTLVGRFAFGWTESRSVWNRFASRVASWSTSRFRSQSEICGDDFGRCLARIRGGFRGADAVYYAASRPA